VALPCMPQHLQTKDVPTAMHLPLPAAALNGQVVRAPERSATRGVVVHSSRGPPPPAPL